eukprot:350570-Chlamydomonas_euryale.AAC.2
MDRRMHAFPSQTRAINSSGGHAPRLRPCPAVSAILLPTAKHQTHLVHVPHASIAHPPHTLSPSLLPLPHCLTPVCGLPSPPPSWQLPEGNSDAERLAAAKSLLREADANGDGKVWLRVARGVAGCCTRCCRVLHEVLPGVARGVAGCCTRCCRVLHEVLPGVARGVAGCCTRCGRVLHEVLPGVARGVAGCCT